MTGFIWLLCALACSGKDADEGDDTAGTDDTAGETGDTSDTDDTELTQEELFAKWINVTDASVGDLTCYDGVTWNTETVDPGCQIDATLSDSTVEEFAFGTDVPNAIVNFYYADEVTGSPDVTLNADASGVFTGTVRTCTPLTYQTYTASTDYRPTYEFHEVYDFEDPQRLELISVAETTWGTLPSIFGVVINEAEGVVAGSVEDCNGDVIEHAQVVLRGATDGLIPSDMVVGYTYNGYPSRVHFSTTEDGIWMAMNVAPGDYIAEMYVSDGAGGQQLIGKAPVQAFAGSVSVVVMNAGIEDGIDIPSSCECSGG